MCFEPPVSIHDITKENLKEKSGFPLEALLPKKETQQEEFLKKYPTYDGRGILMAVLDTGVDPALPGMQKTTTGERKLIDCIDCTGAGDVDTSIVKTAIDGIVVGPTGRELKIPVEWKNPSGEWHLGMKAIYELYPKEVRMTIFKEKMENSWNPEQHKANAETLRKIVEHQGDRQTEEMENLASLKEFLSTVEGIEDKGPIADCIVWNDGEKWMACLDTSFEGRLDLCHPMGEFRVTGEYDKLSDRDEATYTFRVDQNGGNWLEIFVPSGTHGTHVANIAAANFPDEPKKNGLAPGAKVISLTIGDARLNQIETGTALMRAFKHCKEYGVDVVNMSFGEPADILNQGRISEELQKLVKESNVVFISSAGNDGPAISSTGAPGATSTGVIGVGAYFTAEMADPMYGVLKEAQDYMFPFSARGPSADGWLGVSICAPGAAVTGIPRFTRQSAVMKNGTSMASPTAAGSVACILSGLKANAQPWSPYQTRIALENCAKLSTNGDKFSEGHGMLQTIESYEFLRRSPDFLPRSLYNFNVKIRKGAREMRGIYLREKDETNGIKEFQVEIEPEFQKNTEISALLDFEKHLLLKASVPWITAPKTFFSTSSVLQFQVEVDPTAIPPGTAAFGEILGLDSENPHLGPLFRVPVSIIRPEIPDDSKEFLFDSHSGVPVRRFLTAPTGATIAEVKVTNLSRVPLDQFGLHVLQLEEERSYEETHAKLSLGPNAFEWRHLVPVKGGKTVEFCMTRAWKRGNSPAKIRMEVTFHGVSRPDIHLVHNVPVTKSLATAALFRPVAIDPTVYFHSLVVPLSASEEPQLEPMGPKDVSSDGIQCHRLLLNYTFKLLEKTTIFLELPGLSQFFYDSPLDCLLIELHGKSQGHIGFATSFAHRYAYTVEKGDYTVRVQLRHPDASLLEKFKNIQLNVHLVLTIPIIMNVYSKMKDAVARRQMAYGDAIEKYVDATTREKDEVVVAPGEEFPLYFPSLEGTNLPSLIAITGGSYLEGQLTVFLDYDKRSVDKSTVRYHFGESSSPSKINRLLILENKEEEKEEKEQMAEEIRNLKIQWMEKLKDETEKTTVLSQLIQENPTHLPLLLIQLRNSMEKNAVDADEVNVIVERILEISYPSEVREYLGSRHEDNEQKLALKRNVEERKEAIVEALIARATLLVDCHLLSQQEPPSIFAKNSLIQLSSPVKENEENGTDEEKKTVDLEEIKAAYDEVLKWIDGKDEKCLLLSTKIAVIRGHYGKALGFLWKSVEEGRASGKNTEKKEKAISQICSHLGWNHISEKLNNSINSRLQNFRQFYVL